jgi:hypothetical protein
MLRRLHSEWLCVEVAAATICVLFFISPLTPTPDTITLLQQFPDAAGPSGFEEPARKIMVDRVKPYARSIRYDGLGLVIAQQGTEGPRIMLDAHMDELGGIIRRARLVA